MRTGESDAALVQAVRCGDNGAFAVLLARHRPLLLALCQRALGEAELAEDAAQEAIVQALLSLDSLQRAERFGPWLAGIGLNVCRLWLRTRSRERSTLQVLHGGSGAGASHDEYVDPVACSEAAELSARVRQAVEDLPQGQRAAVLLFYLSDLSYAETAAFLGVGVGTVRTRLHKARGTLRRHLRAVWMEENMTAVDKKTEYVCSFCGKNNAEVRRMIAGPKGVFICNECIALCNEIIAKEEAKDAAG